MPNQPAPPYTPTHAATRRMRDQARLKTHRKGTQLFITCKVYGAPQILLFAVPLGTTPTAYSRIDWRIRAVARLYFTATARNGGTPAMAATARSKLRALVLKHAVRAAQE